MASNRHDTNKKTPEESPSSRSTEAQRDLDHLDILMCGTERVTSSVSSSTAAAATNSPVAQIEEGGREDGRTETPTDDISSMTSAGRTHKTLSKGSVGASHASTPPSDDVNSLKESAEQYQSGLRERLDIIPKSSVDNVKSFQDSSTLSNEKDVSPKDEEPLEAPIDKEVIEEESQARSSSTATSGGTKPSRRHHSKASKKGHKDTVKAPVRKVTHPAKDRKEKRVSSTSTRKPMPEGHQHLPGVTSTIPMAPHHHLPWIVGGKSGASRLSPVHMDRREPHSSSSLAKPLTPSRASSYVSLTRLPDYYAVTKAEKSPRKWSQKGQASRIPSEQELSKSLYLGKEIPGEPFKSSDDDNVSVSISEASSASSTSSSAASELDGSARKEMRRRVHKRQMTLLSPTEMEMEREFLKRGISGKPGEPSVLDVISQRAFEELEVLQEGSLKSAEEEEESKPEVSMAETSSTSSEELVGIIARAADLITDISGFHPESLVRTDPLVVKAILDVVRINSPKDLKTVDKALTLLSDEVMSHEEILLQVMEQLRATAIFVGPAFLAIMSFLSKTIDPKCIPKNIMKIATTYTGKDVQLSSIQRAAEVASNRRRLSKPHLTHELREYVKTHRDASQGTISSADETEGETSSAEDDTTEEDSAGELSGEIRETKTEAEQGAAKKTPAYTPRPVGEPVPQPLPGFKPGPKPVSESKPVQKSKREPKPVPTPVPHTGPVLKAVPKPKRVPESKPQTKLEPESKRVPMAVPQPKPAPDSKPVPVPKLVPGSKPFSESRPAPTSVPELVPEPVPESKPAPKPVPVPVPELVSESESESVQESKIAPKPSLKSTRKPVRELKPAPMPVTESVPESGTELDSESVQEAIPESVQEGIPEPVQEAIPEPVQVRPKVSFLEKASVLKRRKASTAKKYVAKNWEVTQNLLTASLDLDVLRDAVDAMQVVINTLEEEEGETELKIPRIRRMKRKFTGWDVERSLVFHLKDHLPTPAEMALQLLERMEKQKLSRQVEFCEYVPLRRKDPDRATLEAAILKAIEREEGEMDEDRIVQFPFLRQATDHKAEELPRTRSGRLIPDSSQYGSSAELKTASQRDDTATAAPSPSASRVELPPIGETQKIWQSPRPRICQGDQGRSAMYAKEEDAQTYLARHNVHNLFQGLISALLRKTPSNPLDFLINEVHTINEQNRLFEDLLKCRVDQL